MCSIHASSFCQLTTPKTFCVTNCGVLIYDIKDSENFINLKSRQLHSLYVTGFHTHKNSNLTFLPEMDCWSNTLSYSTLHFLQDCQVWFLQQLSSDPVKAMSGRLASLNGHGFVVMVCSELGLHRELAIGVLNQFGVIGGPKSGLWIPFVFLFHFILLY